MRNLWSWLGIAQTAKAPILRPSAREQARASQQSRWLLTRADRALGLIRPLRYTYTHRRCTSDTVLSEGSARLWARNPRHARVTWCCFCQRDRPVAEFVWWGSSETVGS